MLIGEFSVDSGQAILIDPCYLNEWVDNEFEPDPNDNYDASKADLNYNDVSNITCSHSTGEVPNQKAVVFETGLGDGCYPVYATYNKEGRISKIEVIFIRDEEED
jgi:hypothetical protein